MTQYLKGMGHSVFGVLCYGGLGKTWPIFPSHLTVRTYDMHMGRVEAMKKTVLVGIILFLIFLVPGDTLGQPFGGHGVVSPPGEATAGLVDGGLHFHGNPAEDHYMFESLEQDSYQYEALHGYEHYRSKELQSFDRFRDIQYPKDQPDSRPSSDSFFGVKSHNPLKW